MINIISQSGCCTIFISRYLSSIFECDHIFSVIQTKLSQYLSSICDFVHLFSIIQTKITADVLKKYVTIDNEIRMFENQNVRKKHDDMSEHLHRAEDELEVLQEQYKECERIT